MAQRTRQGVTLLELLTVLVIFSILLGITASFMMGANKDLGVAAAANHAVSVLRVAHQQSRSASAPSWVVLDTKGGRTYLLLKETIGEWHLEDLVTTGAFGKDGKVTGGTQAQVARVGKGIQLSGSGSISFGEVPLFAADQGLAVEFWFLRRSGRGRGVLCSIGDAVEVSSEPDGHIEAKVGNLRVSSGQIRLPIDAWVYLQLVYSGRDLKLILNRREVQTLNGKSDWARGGVFSVGGSGFTGIVDEVRLGLILPRDEYLLPAECTFAFPAGFQLPDSGEVVIGFDAEGRLDPSVSPQPFTFTIKSTADAKEITIGPGGTLQR
ncbi:MAG: prepilin-type N-terminal cleavage/methylation domain-containing protein [Planctomycetes bacterium]|nr:prepilin-type N-terminal cleavage/methylation domain-containing protein [Planctomycetota bacterium]